MKWFQKPKNSRKSQPTKKATNAANPRRGQRPKADLQIKIANQGSSAPHRHRHQKAFHPDPKQPTETAPSQKTTIKK
jgi:hypothetical protein